MSGGRTRADASRRNDRAVPGLASPIRAILAATIALALTAPGQTAVMAVFLDPMIHSLNLSRSAVSAAYLLGSLAAALALPLLGRLIDRYGTRRVLVATGLCFGAALVAGSTATEAVGLTAAFVGARVGGQGALNLVATTVVAVYVHRRRSLAIGVTTALGTAGVSLAPVWLEHLIAEFGWRQVWALEGVAVIVLVVPLGLFLLPKAPGPPAPRVVLSSSDAGVENTLEPRQWVSGLPPTDWTLSEAMRTGMFWTVATGIGICSLITTALTFHIVSLLGERGLSPTEAAATFIPQTVAGLVASFALGWLAEFLGDRALIIITMALLAATMAGAGWVQPGWSAVVYSFALGVCINGSRTLELVSFSRRFGLRNLGTLRGMVHSVIVGTSALGPLLLALGHSWAGSYRPVLLVLCLLPLTIMLVAILVKDSPSAGAPPVPPRQATASRRRGDGRALPKA